MIVKRDLRQATRNEWRALGFFYDQDTESRTWRLVGSRGGLLRFAALLSDFAGKPGNAQQGEHDHFGPYMYLKVMTWPDAGISENAIHGTPVDLRRLAGLVEEVLRTAEEGKRYSVGMRYAPDAEYDLLLDVRSDDFDPVGADPQLKEAP